MTKYLDYHHVYSYITTSKNTLYPVVTQDTRRVGRGEFHPRTSLRTVREPLDSYGSSNSYNQLRLQAEETSSSSKWSWPNKNSLESADPFANNDITHSFLGYSRYYESVRHKQTHHYFSLSHAGSRLFRLTSSVCFSCSVNMPG